MLIDTLLRRRAWLMNFVWLSDCMWLCGGSMLLDAADVIAERCIADIDSKLYNIYVSKLNRV